MTSAMSDLLWRKILTPSTSDFFIVIICAIDGRICDHYNYNIILITIFVKCFVPIKAFPSKAHGNNSTNTCSCLWGKKKNQPLCIQKKYHLTIIDPKPLQSKHKFPYSARDQSPQQKKKPAPCSTRSPLTSSTPQRVQTVWTQQGKKGSHRWGSHSCWPLR